MATGRKGAKEQIKRTVDTTDALALRAQGMSYRAIGRQLNISTTSAFEYVQAAYSELAETQQETAQMVRDVLRERLAIVYKALLPKIDRKNPDLKAVALWVRTTETEARICGVISAPPVVIQNNIVLKWPDAPAQPDDLVIVGSVTDAH